MTAETGHVDLLAALERESARFGEVLAGVPSGVPVPSCPEWTSDDLLWHLTEVQDFWTIIVRERLADPSAAEPLRRRRPTDRAQLLAAFAEARRELSAVLASTPAETPVWTWSPDRSAGFVRRRQAHEALIHRVDAELTAATGSPLPVALASDGVDEALRVMWGTRPPGSTFTADRAPAARVRTTDTGRSWLLTLGLLRGAGEPGDEPWEEVALEVADHDDGRDVAATLSGRSADLDLYLWNRPTPGEAGASTAPAVERVGDPATLDRLDAMVRQGVT
jgi:uncharacterized protein (TIGR03083 family)